MLAVRNQAIGKPDLKYVQFPYEEALKGMMGAGLSKSVAESFVEMNKAFNEGIIKMPARTAETDTPTTLEQFAQEFAQAYKSA